MKKKNYKEDTNWIIGVMLCIIPTVILIMIGMVSTDTYKQSSFCKDLNFDYLGNNTQIGEGYVSCCKITYENDIRKDSCEMYKYKED